MAPIDGTFSGADTMPSVTVLHRATTLQPGEMFGLFTTFFLLGFNLSARVKKNRLQNRQTRLHACIARIWIFMTS